VIYLMFWPVLVLELLGACLAFVGVLLAAIGKLIERIGDLLELKGCAIIDKGLEWQRRAKLTY
jgi:hypothetical protein